MKVWFYGYIFKTDCGHTLFKRKLIKQEEVNEMQNKEWEFDNEITIKSLEINNVN